MISISFELVEPGDIPVVDREPGLPTVPGLAYAGSGSAYAKAGSLDFKAGLGSQLIASKVRQTLATLAYGVGSKGEIPWRPEYGSSISALRFQNLQKNIAAVVSHFTREALERWVKDITVVNIGVKSSPDIGLLQIKVVYSEVTSKKVVSATVEIQG